MLSLIWTEITDNIWKARNDLVHHGNNLTKMAEESRIDKRLIWYHTNKQEVLARVDYGLTTYDTDALHTMTLTSKRERIRQLDVAKSAFDIEKSMRDKGQHTITRFLVPKHSQGEATTDDNNNIGPHRAD